MYNTFGPEEIIKNVYRISYPYSKDSNVETIHQLKKYYLDFLSDRQSDMPVNRNQDKFIRDLAIEQKLVDSFFEGDLNDRNQSKIIGSSYSESIKERKIEFARRSLEKFLRLDENLADIFDLVIHSIFIRDYNGNVGNGAHGGSSSGSIGAIWLTMQDNITELDLMELYLHELTHHLVFIDELNFAQFNYSIMKNKENYAQSVILDKNRPMDKVVHSIVVGTELIAGRSQYGLNGIRTIHPSTEKLRNNILMAYESIMKLNNYSEIIKPRGLDLIDRCMEIVRSPVEVIHR